MSSTGTPRIGNTALVPQHSGTFQNRLVSRWRNKVEWTRRFPILEPVSALRPFGEGDYLPGSLSRTRLGSKSSLGRYL